MRKFNPLGGYTPPHKNLMKPQRVYGKENHSFNPIEEASLLLNNEIKVISPRSQWYGHIGRVNKVMADGRTLEVQLTPGCTKDVVFLDVTLVDEVREQYPWPKQEQSLGPDANSVLPKNRL